MGKHVDRIKKAITTVKGAVEKFNILKDKHFVELIARVETLEATIKELVAKFDEAKTEAVEVVDKTKEVVTEVKGSTKEAKGKTKEKTEGKAEANKQ